MLHALELHLWHLLSAAELESTTLSFIESETPRLLRLISNWTGILSLRFHAIVNNLVDELRLGKLSYFLRHLCVFMWGQLHHCDGLFQNRQWHTHIDDLFFDSLWRELRLRTTVFAGVVIVAQCITRIPFLCALCVLRHQILQSTCFREF